MLVRTLRRLLPLGALAALAALAAPAAAPAAQAQAPAGPRGAALLQDAGVRRAPSFAARRVATLSSYTPLTLSRMVVPVLGTSTAPDGTAWLKVRLPGRPDGSSGWIPANTAQIVPLHWRIAVSLSGKGVRVYRDGRLVRRFTVVVGAPSTPTPAGAYFVVEHIQLHTSWAPGQWALATNAYSNVLRHFDGGEGQVALHAKGYLVDPLGTAASHGCVRLSDAAAAWLARTIPNGTPLRISR